MCIIFCILILFVSLISYFQINTVLTGVKDSIFGISQNAVIAYDKEDLPYDVYNIDMKKLRDIMQELLYKNHIKGKNKIESIEIEEMYLISNENECLAHTNGKVQDTILHVNLEVSFMPIINIGNVAKLSIHEDIKLSLMKY